MYVCMFVCRQTGIRKYVCVIGWLFCMLKLQWNRLFLYLNTKLKYFCLLVKICCIYLCPKFIHNYNTSYSSYKYALTVHNNKQ